MNVCNCLPTKEWQFQLFVPVWEINWLGRYQANLLPSMWFGDPRSRVAIDLMQLTSSPHIAKRKMDSKQKFGYYSTILSDKINRDQWSLSTAEQLASSSLTSVGSGFTFMPRMHKVSTGLLDGFSQSLKLHLCT